MEGVFLIIIFILVVIIKIIISQWEKYMELSNKYAQLQWKAETAIRKYTQGVDVTRELADIKNLIQEITIIKNR